MFTLTILHVTVIVNGFQPHVNGFQPHSCENVVKVGASCAGARCGFGVSGWSCGGAEFTFECGRNVAPQLKNPLLARISGKVGQHDPKVARQQVVGPDGQTLPGR